MKTFGFIFLFLPLACAFAAECERPFPILGFSGEEMHFQLTGRHTSSKVSLYSEGKLIHTILTQQDGKFTVNELTEGSYWLSVNGWKIATFTIRPLTDSFFPQVGDRTYVLEIPASRIFIVDGHKFKTWGCSSVSVSD